MRMPFGVHKGVETADLPIGYVEWLAAHFPLREPLRSAIQEELRARAHAGNHQSNDGTSSLTVADSDLPLLREVLDAGFRTIARTRHPDAGGDTLQMQRLNAIISSLRQQISVVAR